MKIAPTARFATLAIALSATALAAPAFAQSGHDGMTMDHGDASMAMEQDRAMPMSEGVVKKVDRAAGKLTIAHGPLKNLGMPAMTMMFRVKDASMLDAVREGDKVRFAADRVNGVLTVVTLQPQR